MEGPMSKLIRGGAEGASLPALAAEPCEGAAAGAEAPCVWEGCDDATPSEEKFEDG